MKRYDQQVNHDPPAAYGDCFSTCLRCMLELDEPIPNFCASPTWWADAQAWLAGLGLAFVQMTIPPGNYQWEAIGYHLLGGVSPRGVRHWVIGRRGAVLWDPHPSRAGLSGSLESWDVGLLVMLGRGLSSRPAPPK